MEIGKAAARTVRVALAGNPNAGKTSLFNAITGARLQTLAVPARILAADDDPIIPAIDLDRLAPTPMLRVTRTAHGGHCGFMTGLFAPAYSDDFAMREFDSFQEPTASINRW